MSPEPLVDLQRLSAGIRWRRRLWLTTALVGLVAGMLFTAFLPGRSTAVTRVYVVHENEQSGDSQSTMQTDLAVLETTEVAAAAMQRLGVQGLPEEFVDDYSGIVQAANVLEITAKGNDGVEAVARAQAVADAFVAIHVQRSQDGAAAESKVVLDQRAELSKQLDQVQTSISTATAPGAPAALSSQVEALYGQRSSLSSAISRLDQRADEAGAGVPRVVAGTKIIDSPHETTRRLVVAAAINGVIGLVAGLGLGLAFAAVTAVTRDRPVLRRDIAAELGASVIAQLPRPLILGRVLSRRRSAVDEELKQAASTLVRVVRDAPHGLSVLELGAADVAGSLVLDMSDALRSEGPVVLVDDLPGRPLAELATKRGGEAFEILDGSEDLEASRADRVAGARPGRRIGVGTVAPGTPWTDLRRLGAESLLVVRAGVAPTAWLHTVARQLADARIAVVGIVLVHPDPRDRSDGTLWNGLHTALRGRGLPLPSEPRVSGPATADPAWLPSGYALVPGDGSAMPSTGSTPVVGGNGNGNGHGNGNGSRRWATGGGSVVVATVIAPAVEDGPATKGAPLERSPAEISSPAGSVVDTAAAVDTAAVVPVTDVTSVRDSEEAPSGGPTSVVEAAPLNPDAGVAQPAPVEDTEVAPTPTINAGDKDVDAAGSDTESPAEGSPAMVSLLSSEDVTRFLPVFRVESAIRLPGARPPKPRAGRPAPSKVADRSGPERTVRLPVVAEPAVHAAAPAAGPVASPTPASETVNLRRPRPGPSPSPVSRAGQTPAAPSRRPTPRPTPGPAASARPDPAPDAQPDSADTDPRTS